MAQSVNLKVFFEGEEEAGSPHLDQILKTYATQLRADGWLFCDGPVHQSGRQQLSFGQRGITAFELTVFGPTRPLHSGHYGNWAPNPGGAHRQPHREHARCGRPHPRGGLLR